MKRSPKLQLTGPPAGRIWAETWYITYNHSYWTYNTNLANYGAPPYSCWWYPYDTTLSAGIPKCLPPASNKRWTSASVSSPTLLAGGNTTEIPSDNLTVCYESHGPLVSAHGVFLVYALCFMVIPCHGKKSHHTKPLYENMDWWPSPNNYGKTSHVLSMPHGLIHCVPLGDFFTIQILSTCYRPASSGSATRGMTFTNQACGVTLLELLSFPDFYQEKICFLNWSQKSRISICKSSHLPWSMMIHGTLRQSNLNWKSS